MRFEIRRAGILRNRFRAYLLGANNEKVWWTQPYSSEQSAREAIYLLFHAEDYPID